jgi:hypothetical protein
VPTTNSDLFEMMGGCTPPHNSVSMRILPILLTIFRSAFRARAAVELENFALCHQLNVLKRSVKQRPRLTPEPRGLCAICENLDRA